MLIYNYGRENNEDGVVNKLPSSSRIPEKVI